MRRGLGVMVAVLTLAIGAAALAWLFPDTRLGSSIRDLVFRDRARIGDLIIACGVPGQRCCRWSSTIPGLDPRYCQAGAGCDIATDTCVTPCGGGGQVCCDGPDTYAPQGDRSPTGPYCVDGDCAPRKHMCNDGACTRATRRCDDRCGKTAGTACCPPDAGIAVASCKAPGLVCDFATTDMASGTCVRCGDQGQPPCPGSGCRVSGGVRTFEHKGLCMACGFAGLPKCPDSPRCGSGSAPDPRGPDCIPAGGVDQPCLEGRFCGYDGMFCDDANTCRLCGAPGQLCCPNQPLLGGGVTKECGGYSNLQCANFDGRRVCQYLPGQAPGDGRPPPAQNQPRTCGGQPYQFGVTTTIPVWTRDFTGCAVVRAAFQANSWAEALQCAGAVFGEAVISEPVEMYTFSMDGLLGCRTVYVYAKDEDDASACALAQCINCGEPVPGECP